ncbi:EAL domain-containing protein [Photobacterium sp. 1_MG-2023]|uniref:bifunctional diguanylate cyclase/phosphodiesterase n=1 Tax=Photobacterium sp. 1_MG-2023 TaxID=3062646 RepID=UPI0026E2B5BC|nr:EAL domain-containing protein [Photobacterium sp. 1_MG-2023]MDO6706048.1 EAL domain-containing protein [Photobacterium sp. 1_MG-2023]
MTLYRQTFIWLLLVFTLLLACVFYIQIHSSRSYLLHQQSIDLDNALNAAGLALTPYLEEQDVVGAESVINAMFDGSFYQHISLKIFTPNAVINREYPQEASDVPAIFRQWLPVSPVTRSMTLTSGWLQTAELSMTSNTTVLHRQLWRNANQLFLTLTAILGIGAAALFFGLNRIIRQPLHRLQTKAQAISRNDFGAPLPLPATRELHDVVQAFNHMNSRLQQQFQQQAEEADRLRVQAYQDSVTGLANRRFLRSQLDALLTGQHQGGIIILRADHIETVYQEQGYRAGDPMIACLARQLAEIQTPQSTLGRLSHTELMYISPTQSRKALVETAERMLAITQKLSPAQNGQTSPRCAAAVVMSHRIESVSALLSIADNALNRASLQKDQPIAVVGQEVVLPAFGRQQWLAMVTKAIETDQFTFSLQTAISPEQRPLFREVYASFRHSGETFRANQFMPALDTLSAGAALDRYVLNKMAKTLGVMQDTTPLTVNLSISSITHAGFTRWLGGFMGLHRRFSGRLLFEIPESAFVQHFEQTSLLCDIIRHYNFRFGIDHYGHHFSTLGYLQRFQPYYVKLDPAYTSRLDQSVSSDVLRAITRTAANQHILTIATHIETEARMKALAQLSVTGFQGYGVDGLLGESSA